MNDSGYRSESQQSATHDAHEHDYSDIPDDFSSPSPAEPLSPLRRIRVEPLPTRMSATSNDMWVKVKYNIDHQTPSPSNAKPQHRSSYTEIDPDQEICLEPLPIQMSAKDNDMWVRVKYKNIDGRLPHKNSLGRRPSSLSNLTNTMTSVSGSDHYSNLADLVINVTAPLGTPGSSGQRRHSFTEGDDKNLFIKASTANR